MPLLPLWAFVACYRVTFISALCNDVALHIARLSALVPYDARARVLDEGHVHKPQEWQGT
jgi:hypothetical protein